MWVRLTERRLEAIECRVPEFLWDELTVERVQIAKTVADVRAPAIAWKLISEILLRDIYNRAGQRRTALPRFMTHATQVIVRALNANERHPALRGVGMVGYQAEAFPVWRQPVDDRERLFTIFPAAGEFLVLKPIWQTVNGQRTTVWGPGGSSPGEDRLAEEGTHLRISRNAALVQGRHPHR